MKWGEGNQLALEIPWKSLHLQGRGCGNVGEVPQQWLSPSAPLWPEAASSGQSTDVLFGGRGPCRPRAHVPCEDCPRSPCTAACQGGAGGELLLG